eukprot:CAMPEP_0114307486 /NCGR_PEP_ID=MMETSP0059-20121206/17494_1 /TAXON_ID=36894 /ORGANISM="Pyramimonas parkeae, Strain CCMP726" /LENGTH=84 /DNA_ID=CAMNT_0001430951 /DNA_START=76 /DNA_END=330 /DNA_ORIENTATION=+
MTPRRSVTRVAPAGTSTLPRFSSATRSSSGESSSAPRSASSVSLNSRNISCDRSTGGATAAALTGSARPELSIRDAAIFKAFSV